MDFGAAGDRIIIYLDSSTRATVYPGVYHRVKAELARTMFGKRAARDIEGGGLKSPPLSCVRVPGRAASFSNNFLFPA